MVLNIKRLPQIKGELLLLYHRNRPDDGRLGEEFQREYRYFYKGTGIMATNGFKNSKGDMRYFASKSGKMSTGWLTNSKGQMRYFFSGSGFMAKGWLKNSKGDMRYFYNGSGVMATGWLQNSDGERRFFDTDDGKMKTGWVKNSSTGETFYFNEKSGIAATGTLEMDGFKYVFSDKGVLQSSEMVNPSGGSVEPTGKRTVKRISGECPASVEIPCMSGAAGTTIQTPSEKV